MACFLLDPRYVRQGANDRLGHHRGKRGHDMSDDLMRKWELSRRRVLGAAAGLGAAGLAGGGFGAQTRPWGVGPQNKGERPQFVVWYYAGSYTPLRQKLAK